MKLLKTVPALPVQHIETAVRFYEHKMGFSCQHRDNAFAKLVRDEVKFTCGQHMITAGNFEAYCSFSGRYS